MLVLFSYSDLAYAALALFLVAIGLGVGWAFFRLAVTFDSLSSLIRGAEREALPVVNKVGGSVDRVNAQLDKLDTATDSAVDAVEAVDEAVRSVSFAVKRPVQKVAGLSEAEIIDVANLSKADPLVPRSSIFGVDERVDRNGDVVAPLDPARLNGLRERLREQGVEAIAVSLLWSFLNPGHERQLADWLGDGNGDGAPDWFVTASSDLVPVLREYERTSTTVLNAYLTPSVNGYLERMRERLRVAGHCGAIAVMHSAGGV